MKLEVIVVLGIFAGFILLEVLFTQFFRKDKQVKGDGWVDLLSTLMPWLYKLHRPHHQAEYLSIRIVYRNNIFYYFLMPGLWFSGVLIYLGGGWVYARQYPEEFGVENLPGTSAAEQLLWPIVRAKQGTLDPAE